MFRQLRLVYTNHVCGHVRVSDRTYQTWQHSDIPKRLSLYIISHRLNWIGVSMSLRCEELEKLTVGNLLSLVANTRLVLVP